MVMILRFLAALLLAAWVALASAQVSVPAPAPASSPAHVVSGFRSARFGMSADEVRQAITSDFKPAAAAVTMLDNPAERTQIIMLRLPVLEPGPGPAVVSYILGAASRRLMHVNVVWTTGANPTDSARNEIAAAAVLLDNYLRQEKWTRMNGNIADAHGVLLFAGMDAKKAAVELRVTGVAVAGGGASAAAPSGPAQLRMSYIANVVQPDILTLKPGSF